VAKAEDDRVVEAEQLPRSIREISDTLVDLSVLPIRDVPSQPWSAKDVLAVFSLVLERLREGRRFINLMLSPSSITTASGRPAYYSIPIFCFWGVRNVHKYIYIYIC
jgi:hypothetical protein